MRLLHLVEEGKEGVTKEDEDYYASFFEMFRSDGWKQLILELQTNANSINSVEATKDADDLYFRKGQINVLAYIINLEGSTLASFEELTDSNDLRYLTFVAVTGIFLKNL